MPENLPTPSKYLKELEKGKIEIKNRKRIKDSFFLY